LSWDKFKLCYDSVYPEGQTWLPCGGTDALAVAVDPHPVPSKASQANCDEVESRATLRKKSSTPHDPTCECFVL
jgi:hypothetical protein